MTCLSSNKLAASAAIFVAAHFAMGFINPSAGGSGGALIFRSRATPARAGSSARSMGAPWSSSSRS